MTTCSDWIYSFEIPWNKFPPALLEAVKLEIEPKPNLRAEMVRIIVDEIFKYTQKPSKKSLEKIAFTVVKKYPSSFKDQIDGMSVGVGHSSFTQQLVYRVDNVKRSAKRFLVRPTNQKSKRKCDDAIAYGCIAWSPPLNSDVDNDKKSSLLEEFQKVEPDLLKVSSWMKETYPQQREFINKHVSIESIKKNWPFLFYEQLLLSHFTLLTGKLHDISYEEIEHKSFYIWK